jgi:TonB family protein
MRKSFIICLSFLNHFVMAQKITNIVMVGENGITENANLAKYLIVIKSYGDTAFERLEYNFTGPMKKRMTYKDPLLKILNGSYLVFAPSGFVSTEGMYRDNKKDGSWYLCNDTGKAIIESKYHLDTLLAIIDLDSLYTERQKLKQDTTDEHEAVYKGGEKKYQSLIHNNLKIPERTQSLEAGGTVRVRFIIDPEGNVTDVHILRSVEFAFDEEVMRVVSSVKGWIPASQKGRKVNAYREQPITISFQ